MHKNLPRIHAAIVDLDGTLVDTLGDFEVALNRTLADLALPPVTRTLVAHTVGQGSEHLIRSVLAHQLALSQAAGATPHDMAQGVNALYDTAWQRYQHHYRAINGQHAQVFAGVTEGLQVLRAAGLPLACLTNKPQRFAQDLLQTKGLAVFFDQVWGGDSFARKKPDPLPVLETCKALGTAAAHTLMLGDSRNDAQAAHAAGCPVVLVTYGYNHGEPIAAVPCAGYVDSLAELAQWLG